MGFRNWVYEKTGISLKRKKMKKTQVSSKQESFLMISEPFQIRPNVKIGQYTYIMSNSNIYSNTTIGRYCSIAPNIVLLHLLILLIGYLLIFFNFIIPIFFLKIVK